MTTERASAWSLTINNPTDSDEECIALARQKGWRVEGQKEKGAEGTSHYQLFLQTPQVRFSAIKKAFPRAHIEVARNIAALKAYVHKADTREGELPLSNAKYPSLSKFWHLIFERCQRYNWIDWSDSPIRHWWKEAFDFFCVPRFNYDDWSLPAPTQQQREDFAFKVFTDLTGELIREGFHVEHFYSPPNISVFKKFHFQLLQRAFDEINAQTARQTDALDLQEVDVPTIHNNAQEDVSEEESSESSPSPTHPPSSPSPPQESP